MAQSFLLYLIKPSHYDDDGYVIRWARSEIPSNSLAALHGIALDARERRVLGDDVDLRIEVLDETNTRVDTGRIVNAIREQGGKGLVALVGVQSNQFPRAMDLARPLRRAGVPVCIGGFHVSGCISMLPHTPPDLREAAELGVSLFAGEAEGRLETVLQDAWNDDLAPLYDYVKDLPGLAGVPVPSLPVHRLRRNVSTRTSFDSGRGCPFQCSFCTIINVQGRKSRYRDADDIEKIIRENHARGVKKYFITDDNLARNRNWEAIFDRIILLRKYDRIKCKFIIQVDTLTHKIPGFVEKAAQAGVNKVFIGLENVNPANLKDAKKKQNQIGEYRAMLQAWKSVGVITICGYILGFPKDTPEGILRDIETIQTELPIDILEFFILTPLPGSEDHKLLDAKGVWMDPDMNKYDLEHVVTAHPRMSREEFLGIYHRAWDAYYTPEHVETMMRRAVACGIAPARILKKVLSYYGTYKVEHVHPLQGGFLRRRARSERRSGLPPESALRFYARYAWEQIQKPAHWLWLTWFYWRMLRRVEADPNRHAYTDLALTPGKVASIDGPRAA